MASWSACIAVTGRLLFVFVFVGDGTGEDSVDDDDEDGVLLVLSLLVVVLLVSPVIVTAYGQLIMIGDLLEKELCL